MLCRVTLEQYKNKNLYDIILNFDYKIIHIRDTQFLISNRLFTETIQVREKGIEALKLSI